MTSTTVRLSSVASPPSPALNVHDALHHPPEVRSRTIPAVSPFEWFFVITGGAALFLPLLLWAGESRLGRSDTIRWYFWINSLISSPHVYATYVRLQRKINERKVHWCIGFPTYIGSVAILAFASAAGYFVEVMTAVNVWQSFHYLRQTYGVGCFYGRQESFDERDRLLRWWAYHLVIPLLVIGRWDTLYDAWQGKTHSLIPLDFGLTIMVGLWFLAAAGIYLAIVAEGRLLWKNRRRYRIVGLINFAVFLGIHAYGFMVLSHYQRGFFAVTIFHAIQYLAMIWVFERRQANRGPTQWISQLPNLLGFGVFWLVLFALGFGYEQHISVAANNLWIMASAILLAAVSVHHYITDTFIWRRSVGA